MTVEPRHLNPAPGSATRRKNRGTKGCHIQTNGRKTPHLAVPEEKYLFCTLFTLTDCTMTDLQKWHCFLLVTVCTRRSWDGSARGATQPVSQQKTLNTREKLQYGRVLSAPMGRGPWPVSQIVQDGSVLGATLESGLQNCRTLPTTVVRNEHDVHSSSDRARNKPAIR